MGKHRENPNRPAPTYKTGYRKAPTDYRFQPGNSANPRGRPKKPKLDPAAIVRDALMEKVEVLKNGRMVTVSMLEAWGHNMVRSLVKEPARTYKANSQIIDRALALFSPDEGGSGVDYSAEVRRKIEAVAQRLAAAEKRTSESDED